MYYIYAHTHKIICIQSNSMRLMKNNPHRADIVLFQGSKKHEWLLDAYLYYNEEYLLSITLSQIYRLTKFKERGTSIF